MFSSFYEPLPDLKKTLERIGCENLEIRHDLETLDALIMGYSTHVPYENLEVSYEHHLPSLAVKDLYNKIVAHRRGGYCFEMNGIFWALLRDLGFDVYSVSVYVLENVDSMGDLGHRSNIVTIDGEKYFVEVGFGRNSVARSAVPLNGHIRNGFFISYDPERREYTVYKIVEEDKEKARGFERFLERKVVDGEEVVCKRLQLFRDFIAYPQEFYLPNKGVFYTPENRMIGKKICHFRNEKDETYSIADNEFRSNTAEGWSSREIKDDADLRAILKKYFGIELPERDKKPQLPPYYVAPPIYDENGNKIEYGKHGCPKGRDLSTFTCPCNFPKCVYLKENAECFERMMRESNKEQKRPGQNA